MSLNNDQSALIAAEVRGMLARSQAFAALPSQERDRILDSTTRVASQLVAQRLEAPPRPPRSASRDPYVLAQADEEPFPFPGGPAQNGGTSPAPTPPAGPPAKWRPDERFQAEGIAAGVTQATRMVKEVDFPAFVSSLVKGTFNAVVDASIQQMKAYGELVNSVAMSINQFRDQNVEVGEGQKHLASKYPDVFGMESGKLQVKEDFDEDAMPDFQAELGLPGPVEELDEETIGKMVTAARTELARGRQQLLATTILMGINRIIVTDGKINAKIKFDFTAHDTMTRTGTVNEYDTSQKKVRDLEMGVGERYARGHFETPIPLRVSTTSADSKADIEASAKLTGEVSLNFRSETFPLERMMSSDQMFQINQAHSGARGVPAAPRPANSPAPAPPAAQQPPAPAPAPAAPTT